jgi:hypothetical protein
MGHLDGRSIHPAYPRRNGVQRAKSRLFSVFAPHGLCAHQHSEKTIQQRSHSREAFIN